LIILIYRYALKCKKVWILGEGGRDYVDLRYAKTGVCDRENYLITVSTVYVLRLSLFD